MYAALPPEVLTWQDTFVLHSPALLAAAATDASTLRALCEGGLADFSLFAPPCSDPRALAVCDLPLLVHLELLHPG